MGRPAHSIALPVLYATVSRKGFVIFDRPKNSVSNCVTENAFTFYFDVFNSLFCLFPFTIKEILPRGIILKPDLVIVFYITCCVR